MVGNDSQKTIDSLEKLLAAQKHELEALKCKLESFDKSTKAKFVEQEHRLIRSAIQFFRSFFLKSGDGLKAESASAFFGNIWGGSRRAMLITGGGFIGFITIILMHNANELIKKQNIHLRTQNYQNYIANRENSSINVFEKLYEEDIAENKEGEYFTVPRFSDKTRENAFRAFFKMRNESISKPVPYRELSLLTAVSDVLMPAEAKVEENENVINKSEFIPMSGIYLDQSDLSGIDLTGYKLNLSESKLNNATLNKLFLRGADFTSAELNSTKLIGAKLEGAIFNFAELVDANLSEAQLQGAIFSDSKLNKVRLVRAVITRTQFLKSNLSNANLSNASGELVNFDFADLSNARLTNINLSTSSFLQAVLIGSDFSGATLKDTSFAGANLKAANFKNAKELTCEQLSNAKNVEQAINIPIKCP